jgi:hypothetical protein
MATIKILRACPANKIIGGEATPVYGPQAGRTFTGTLRPDGHPDNNEWSEGCVEIDTADDGTWVFPADAVEIIN